MIVKLTVAQQRFKFSAAHMTVFGPSSKERLHGHNYAVRITVEYEENSAKLFDLLKFKSIISEECNLLDERTLLPIHSPYWKELSSSKDSIEFILCNERYRLPVKDIVMLPVRNVTMEELSGYLCDRILEKSKKALRGVSVKSIRVTVAESFGLEASVKKMFDRN